MTGRKEPFLKFTIPVKARTKKNHGQIVMIGKYPRMLPSKQYKEFEEQVVNYVEAMFGNLEPIDFTINLKCTFYREKRYKADLCGYLQGIQDALVKAELLKDDNCKIVYSTDGSVVSYDKNNPRIEIEITKLDNVNPDEYKEQNLIIDLEEIPF